MSELFSTIWSWVLWIWSFTAVQSVAMLVILLVLIAFLLLMDRKVWAAVQMRRGPNVVGPFGLFQSFADLLKFVFKEPLIPAGSDKVIFLLAPLATATFALASWAVIPVNEGSWGKWVISDMNVGVLYLLAISSLGVYGIIMGGWASNSKYPFMGSLRSAAQMVSYEVSIGLVIICVLLLVGSLNLTDIVNAQKTGIGTHAGLSASFLDWYWLVLFPMFVVFFICIDNNMREYFFGADGSVEWNTRSLKASLPGFVHYSADIRDAEAMKMIFARYGKNISVVIHAAAQPSHDWAANEPLTDFSVNAMGTLVLLETVRDICPDAPFIFTSTNKVYGDTPNVLPLVELDTRWEIDAEHPYFKYGIDETMSIDASKHSVFGASKVAADVMTQEYGRYFGLKTGVFRGGCLTGPAHSGAMLHGFLAYLIKCIVHRKPYTIFGYKGKQVRDNIYTSGGVIDLVGIGLDFSVDADGMLHMEFFEGFDDAAGLMDGLWQSGALTIQTAPAVPEPGTYAMMLLGLAAMGGLARRRKA